jgi:hypothetical protein
MSYLTLADGRINCRVKITGTYKGERFVYTDPEGVYSQYYLPDGNPSRFWWEEGNMACDCNRGVFIDADLDCGNTVCIDTIEPLNYDGDVLRLDESRRRGA